jgi:hypothetical protein
MSIVLDDITAWHEFPRSRWMLNKLYVQQRFGVDCGPVGVNPSSYPVWVKPVINVQGLGIGSKKIESRHMMHYEPGMMWMPFYEGEHMSYDIKWEASEPMQVYAAKGLNGPYFTEWQVDRIEPDYKLQSIVYKLAAIGEMPTHFNIETIGGNLIECHPRWGGVMSTYYDKCPYSMMIYWTKDYDQELPEGWIDYRYDESNKLTDEFKRIGYKIVTKEK